MRNITSIVEKKYLSFLKKQEITAEPFYDKLGQLKNFYLPICRKIFFEFLSKNKTLIIGLSGGQGSGKSTIARILKIILKEKYNLKVINFSIDDFYKTLSERKIMSSRSSKLFLTRGVPGTHDTKLLLNCFRNLLKKRFKKIKIPQFDKSIDDRLTKEKWLSIRDKPNIIIFEGWCVGAKSQSFKKLRKPINKLEKIEDKKLKWRKKVNSELNKDYKKIFDLIDKMIFLKVPSFKFVLRWRLLQEKKLRAKFNGKGIMTIPQVKKFVMYYERITKDMLKDLDKSDIVINLDKRHRLSEIRFN